MIDQDLVLWDAGDEIATKIAIAGDFLPAGNLIFPPGAGWREMARNLAGCFEDVAATFVNLECAIPRESLPSRPLVGIGQIVLACPRSLVYLQSIRAQPVGMANNHSYDFREAGVTQTRDTILSHGMFPLGAGRTLSEPPEVFVDRKSVV